MGNFFTELKRRHIYRVAAAYAVVAWVLLQLFNNLQPILKLPDWAGTLVLVLLLGGLPVALLLAWARELPAADGATARATTGRLDWALMGALTVVIALTSYQQLSPAGSKITAEQASIPSGGPGAGAISIAVLPFANLSGDASQEFFSDGMTEEIMTALAKVPALRVVGRESAFQFKDRKTDMRSVGQALGASYLVEGSVRKAGDQVRITAQLVEAGNGVSRWTDSYDREMKNIFATQSDIAQAIAGALRVPLGLKQGETLVANRTNDLESYQKYLQAKALVRARAVGLKPLTDAVALLEQVVAADPNYAPAWAQMALAYAVMPTFHPATINFLADEGRSFVEASLPKAEVAANRTLQLNPNLAEGYLAEGYVQYVRQKLVAAEVLLSKALALDGNNPDALSAYATLLSDAGHVKEALVMRQKVQVLEPFVPLFNNSLAHALWLSGRNEEAISILKAAAPDQFIAPFYLSRIYASEGRYNEAADILLRIPEGIFLPGRVETAARVIRTAPASPQAAGNLGYLNWVYVYTDKPDRWLDAIEANLQTSGYLVASGLSPLWHSSFAPVRKAARFKPFARKAGLVDYWRAKGWPDLCHPVGVDDFVCE